MIQPQVGFDIKIDIVYTWVDGSDPDWQARKKTKLEEINQVLPEANCDARFMDNNELKYSLRSIHKFASWVNNIFIVTDNQKPDWLNTANPKIKLVDHKDIFNDTSTLPTFSARGIESQLHHIKDLSEHFIYFNDDMFLGSRSTPDQFFIDEKTCRVFVSEIIAIPNKKAFNIALRKEENRNDHQHAIVNTRKLIRDKFNRRIFYNIRHGAKPLLKSVLFNLENLFHEDLVKTSKNSFRTEDDILMFHLFEYYSLIKGIGKSKYLKTVKKGNSLSGFNRLNKRYTFGYINFHDSDVEEKLEVIQNNRPFMLCLNHTPTTPEKNLELLDKFLIEFYPEKSPFEKN